VAADKPVDDQIDEPADQTECERARRCPGWVVTPAGFVEQCGACASLPADDEAHMSARAAGLDVQSNGFVIGLPGVGRPRPGPRSEAYRATVSANDILVGVLEQLQDVLRLDRLPLALRSSVDYLAIEVAKVQGVSEWISEDLVRLAEEEV